MSFTANKKLYIHNELEKTLNWYKFYCPEMKYFLFLVEFQTYWESEKDLFSTLALPAT